MLSLGSITNNSNQNHQSISMITLERAQSGEKERAQKE